MNTGLVLSEGGVGGIAHSGSIKALEEVAIYPTHISGLAQEQSLGRCTRPVMAGKLF